MESGASTSVDHGGTSNGNMVHRTEVRQEVGSEQSLFAGAGDETAWETSSKQGLLPGIPDEITLNLILTRLPWNNVYTLASLCRSWRTALRSREVHDARLRANSTQTLVAMIHDDPFNPVRNLTFAVSFYDFARDTWHLLPQIPGIYSGIPQSCGCVAVNSKLYVIGGRGDVSIFFSREVYQFDPCGSGRWKQCASMISGRASFGSDVKDGKIYVFGGMGAEGKCEVYDPVQDVWHSIAPMLTNRIQHKVVHLGKEFYVHMGKYFIVDRGWTDANFAEVYDCSKDEWRRLPDVAWNKPAPSRMVEAVLVIYGRMFKILDDWLYLYDQHACSWSACRPISWDGLRFGRGFFQQNDQVDLTASAVAVRGALLALVYDLSPANELVLTPLRSGVRFGQPLAWKKIHSTLHFHFRQCHCLCPMEL